MLIRKGTILDKWHHNDIPSPQEVKTDYIPTGKTPDGEQGTPQNQEEASGQKEMPS
jgi:hypothetical protein